MDNAEKYPERWQPVLDGLLEVLNEYAPDSVSLVDVVNVGGKVQIWLAVPWSSDVISTAHRLAERILTKMEEA